MNNFSYIDIHCHTNFAVYDDDRKEVIERAQNGGVAMINVGTQKDTSKSAVLLANEYSDGVYAIVGLHPIHTSASFRDEDEIGEGEKGFNSRGEVFDTEYYRELANDPKVVGIGECGLDYFRTTEESEKVQREAFSKQIALANEVGKPLMLHVRSGNDGRNAYDDVYNILKNEAKVSGNVHFFAGSKEDVRKFLDLGFTCSFTGVITFAKEYEELVSFVPEDMIHAETDAPYVTPAPNRGKRNEPFFVTHVVEKMAQIKGKSTEEMASILKENAKRLFKI